MKLKNGIVIDKLKCVYWYIPKNACTSFKTFFGRIVGADFDPNTRNPERNAHGIEFKMIYPSEAARYSGYLHFAVVRDPLRRLYSLYRNKIHPDKRNTAHCENGVEKYVFGRWKNRFWGDMEFWEFAEAIAEIPTQDADPHFAPQYLLLSNSGGIVANRIVKMESLQRDAGRLMEEIGIKGEELPVLNETRYERRPLDGVSEFTRAKVYRHYKVDCELFGYNTH